MRPWLIPFSALILLGATGCDRPSSDGVAPGVTREVLCDMDGVMIVIEGSYPWNVSISPSGAHIAVKRSMRDDLYLNKHHDRMDVDGLPGKEFDSVRWWPETHQGDDTCWSQDGSTAAYIGKDFEPPPHREFFVHGSTVYGPFQADGVSFALSPDGRRWAAWVQPLGVSSALADRQLMVDGQFRQLSFVMDWKLEDPPGKWLDRRWLVYDPMAQQFVVQAAPGQWRTLDGRTARMPPDRQQPTRLPLPERIVIQTPETTNAFRFGRHQELRRRRELRLNDRLLGEFDFILGGSSHSAYPQPDGGLIFYVARDNQLIRLRVQPGAVADRPGKGSTGPVSATDARTTRR